MATHQSSLSGHIESLTCRALILLTCLRDQPWSTATQPRPTSSISGYPVVSSYTSRAYAELESDTKLCCKRLIDASYEQYEQEGKPRNSSFIHAYELFDACTTYVFLSRNHARGLMLDGSPSCAIRTTSSSTGLSQSASSPNDGLLSMDPVGLVVQKCSTLITILSLQYPPLRAMQRSLMAISARLSGSV
ncbi:hypothetical protein Micbo1qcDRAFT_167005, partial [Microdochium bolleyi]